MWSTSSTGMLLGILPNLLGKVGIRLTGTEKDMVKCTSRRGQPQICDIPPNRMANLVEVLDGTYCEEGHTLFYGNATIKVTFGCSGMFKLSAGEWKGCNLVVLKI